MQFIFSHLTEYVCVCFSSILMVKTRELKLLCWSSEGNIKVMVGFWKHHKMKENEADFDNLC